MICDQSGTSWVPDDFPHRPAKIVVITGKSNCRCGYTGQRGYHPLLAIAAGTGDVLMSRLREGRANIVRVVDGFLGRPLDGGPYPYLWLDTLTQKVREDGRIVNVSVVVATAVNGEGKREIIGMDVGTSEDGAFWLAFLRSLSARGLSGVELVVSDAHQGLRGAIAAVFGGASWQRCRTHFMTNLLTRVPRRAQPWVATMVRTIYQQPSPDEVHAQLDRVTDQLQDRFPQVASLLDEAGPDILAFSSFPVPHWKKIWSNNPLERLNKEIRRRTDVVGIFPNRPAVRRLVGAVLAEQHDEWAVGRRYLTPAVVGQVPDQRQRADPRRVLVAGVVRHGWQRS